MVFFPLFTYHSLPLPPLNSDEKIWFCRLTKLHRLPRFLTGWNSGEQWLPHCCWSSTAAVCQEFRGESGQSAWPFRVLTGLSTQRSFKDRRNQESLIPEDIMSSTQGQNAKIVYSCSCWSHILKGFEVQCQHLIQGYKHSLSRLCLVESTTPSAPMALCLQATRNWTKLFIPVKYILKSIWHVHSLSYYGMPLKCHVIISSQFILISFSPTIWIP